MEFVIAAATSIVGKVAEYTVSPVASQLGYLFCYSSNIDNLGTQIQELKMAKDRLQHRVDNARRNGEEIETDVQDWLSKVDDISEEAENFLNDDGHIKTRCTCRSFPHLVSRHQLSRKAKKKTESVIRIQECGSKFDTISYCPHLESSVEIFNGYETFGTRMAILKDIKEALRDPNVRMVGVYGMGGIGKTMLVQEAARKALRDKLFEEVVDKLQI